MIKPMLKSGRNIPEINMMSLLRHMKVLKLAMHIAAALVCWQYTIPIESGNHQHSGVEYVRGF